MGYALIRACALIGLTTVQHYKAHQTNHQLANPTGNEGESDTSEMKSTSWENVLIH